MLFRIALLLLILIFLIDDIPFYILHVVFYACEGGCLCFAEYIICFAPMLELFNTLKPC